MIEKSKVEMFVNGGFRETKMEVESVCVPSREENER